MERCDFDDNDELDKAGKERTLTNILQTQILSYLSSSRSNVVIFKKVVGSWARCSDPSGGRLTWTCLP